MEEDLILQLQSEMSAIDAIREMIARQNGLIDAIREMIASHEDVQFRCPKLSEPISGCPPNKHRALSQKIHNLLTKGGYISLNGDFVGEINTLETFFIELEKDGFIVLSDQMYQD